MLLSTLMVAALLGSSPSPVRQAGIVAPDPVSEDLLARSAEWAEAARKAGAFPFPATATPWPCAVADLELRKATRSLELAELTPLEKRMRIMELRRNTMLGIPTPSYRPLRAHLVSGTCRNGQLHGPVEYLLSHDVTEDSPASTTRYRLHQRIAATFADGVVDPASPVTFAHIMDGMQTVLKNGQQGDRPKADRPEADRIEMSFYLGVARSLAEPLQGAEASTHLSIVNGKAQPVTTTLVTPQPDGRTSHIMYRGDQKTVQFYRRNGLYEGIFEAFPMKTGNHTVPGWQKCYIEGEEVLTEPCEAE